jgi:hypothetical protein
MMFLTNILCLIGGVALGILTTIRLLDVMCDLGLLKMTVFNCNTGKVTTFGSIDPEHYED